MQRAVSQVYSDGTLVSFEISKIKLRVIMS